ncbi:ACP S-malonyltransferase [Acuticoccus sediminis]|uniref:ACP S-malonyltransferase n=1 Tax=Acuticoccus sediminis TaxID=2184697 RepID=UPI001CFEFA95|nr:hypothetical protein [Acuticoccus sediminis]
MTDAQTTSARYTLFFTGRGRPAWDMALRFANADREAREQYEWATEIVGRDLIALTTHRDPRVHSRVEVQTVGHPLAAAIALDYARRHGLPEPAAVGGLSLGEMMVAYATGALDFETMMRLACERGRVQGELAAKLPRGGTGLLIGSGADGARDLCDEVSDLGAIQLAGILAPDVFLVSGFEPALSEAAWLAREMGWRWIPQPSEAPWHTDAIQPAREAFEACFATHPVSAPKIPFISASREEPVTDEAGVREVIGQSITGYFDVPAIMERLQRFAAGRVTVRLTPRGSLGRPDIVPPGTVMLNVPGDLPEVLAAIEAVDAGDAAVGSPVRW